MPSMPTTLNVDSYAPKATPVTDPGTSCCEQGEGAVNPSTGLSLDITLDITGAVDPPRARRLAALLLGLVAPSTLDHSTLGSVGAARGSSYRSPRGDRLPGSPPDPRAGFHQRPVSAQEEEEEHEREGAHHEDRRRLCSG